MVHLAQSTHLKPLKTEKFRPDPNQPNPTRGSTEPTDNSDLIRGLLWRGDEPLHHFLNFVLSGDILMYCDAFFKEFNTCEVWSSVNNWGHCAPVLYAYD